MLLLSSFFDLTDDLENDLAPYCTGQNRIATEVRPPRQPFSHLSASFVTVNLAGMKNHLIILIAAAVVISCGSKKSGQPENNGEDTLAAPYSWEATLNDSTGKLQMNKIEHPGPDSLTVPAVIAFLNKKNPNVQLQFLKVSGDTLYISIPDAHYLTRQMGSTGPVVFFAESVYNLTEIPGIRYVNYDFEEGDHAQPDVFTRNNFEDP